MPYTVEDIRKMRENWPESPQAQQVQQEQPQQGGALGSWGNLAQSISQGVQKAPQFLGGVARGLGEFGKDVGLTATKLPRVVGTSAGLAIRSLLPKGITAQDLTPEGLAKMMPLLTPAEREKLLGQESSLESQVGELARSVAATGAFLIPGSRAAAGAGKLARIAGASAKGGVAGGLYTAGQEDTTPSDVLSATGTSALFSGGLTAGGMAVGGVAGKLKGGGQRIRESILEPKVKPTPTGQLEKGRIAEKVLPKIKGGSASQMWEQVGQQYESLASKVKSVVKGKTVPYKGSTVNPGVYETLSNAFENNPAIVADVPGYQSAGKKLLGAVGNMADESGNIKVQDLLDYKLQKLNWKPGAATPQQEMINTVWSAIDDVIASAAPKAKELTLEMSNLWKASPGLKRSAEGTFFKPTGVVPIVGKLPGLHEISQKGADLAGRTSIKWGESFGKLQAPFKGTFNSLVGKLPPEVQNRLLNWFTMTATGQIIAPEGQGLPQIGGQQ